MGQVLLPVFLCITVCYGLNSVLPETHVEALTPTVTVSETEHLRK